MGKVWAVVSGKGGIGRSTLAVMVGMAVSRMGKRALLIDANAGLRNLDMLLGMENRVVFDLSDVFEHVVPKEQAILQHRHAEGLSLLCGPQFAEEALDGEAFHDLAQKLAPVYDAVIIDTPAGVGTGLKAVLNACDEALLLSMPDDASMRIAERMGNLLRRADKIPHLVVYRTDPMLVEMGLHYTPDVVGMTLDMPVYAEIPADTDLPLITLRREWEEPWSQPLLQAVTQLACRMLDLQDTPDLASEPAQTGFMGWVKRMRGRV